MIYIITGQSGTGKTSLSEKMKIEGLVSVVIDGDRLRKVTNNSGYSAGGRISNMKDCFLIASYLHSEGVNVAISMVFPIRSIRDELKTLVNAKEIYLTSKDKRGKDNFYYKEYEKPENDFIHIDTEKKTIEQTFNELLLYL